MELTPNLSLVKTSMADRVDQMVEYTNASISRIDMLYPIGIVLVLDNSSTFDPNTTGHGTWTMQSVRVTSTLTYKYWTRTA